jgi:hypothetical protein
MIGGRGPFRRRGLVTDAPLAAGEPVTDAETDDFLRCEGSRTRGELALDALDLPAELLLTVRSSAGATGGTDIAADFVSSSGNKENQVSAIAIWSAWNIGEVSKLSLMKGESPISGEVKFVNAVEGGADWVGSAKMSLGETVRVDPEETEGSLIDVNADVGASQEDMSFEKPCNRLAPESNELLLCKSARGVSLTLA